MAKYYGMQPSEIEETTVRRFNEYLRQIPDVERVLNGRAGNPACQDEDSAGADSAHGSGSLSDLLNKYGIEEPHGR